MLVNLHVVLNNFRLDSRVLRETKSLASNCFDKIYIAALWEDGVRETERLDNKRQVWRVRVKARKLPRDICFQTVKYVEWVLRIYLRFIREEVAVVHCHDLAALPVGILFKFTKKSKVIYDAHELETEQESGYPRKRSLRTRLSWILERLLIPAANAMITVSPSILRWYADRFPQVPISLVRNIPSVSKRPESPHPLRRQLKVPDNALLFLYLGMFYDSRGIQIVLKAFQNSLVSHHLVFMGSGPLRGDIERAISVCPRIHLVEPVPPKDVLRYSSGADVGICLYEDTCLSLRFSLPNKLFESLLGGAPVLASDLPDQSEIVRRHNAGWIVQNNSDSLVQFLIGLTVEEARRMRAGMNERLKHLSWDTEAKVLFSLYENVLT